MSVSFDVMGKSGEKPFLLRETENRNFENPMTKSFIAGIAMMLAIASAASAQLVIEPQLGRDIGFPDTPVGQSHDINYTATSRGNGPWTVRLNTNNQVYSVNPNQFVVQDGQAVQFRLRFSPAQQGVVNGLLTGSYDNGDALVRVNSSLTGRGVQGGGARIETDLDTLDFYIYADELGTIWQGLEETVTITNTGNSQLSIQSISDNAEWLTCDHNGFAIGAGQSADVVVSIAENALANLTPDFYEAVITVTSNAGNQQRLTIPVYFYRGFVPHFLVVIGDEEPPTNHAIVVDDATIEEEELAEWDEIGLFTPRGDIAGSVPFETEWPLAFIAWGEDPEAGFAGFRRGDAFDFRLWDASAGREYRAEAQFVDGARQYAPEGVSEVILSTSPEIIDQVIPLRAGWNSISLRIRPEERYWATQEGPDVIRLFESIVGHTQMVKDDRGAFYLPAHGYNGIAFARLDRGLQVRMAAADTLVVRGVPIPEDTEISLTQGWNLVAYYPNESLTMAAAYQDLTGRNLLAIAKDAFGRFYLPNINFGGNNLVAPNNAILVSISENCSFRYPANQVAFVSRPSFTDDDSTSFFPRVEPTSENMSILITQIEGIRLRNGAEIACKTQAGTIAGASRLNGPAPWGMAIWADDAFTENVVEGFVANEPLQFSYYDGLHQWEWVVEFDILEGGEAIFRTNSLLVIGVHVAVESENVSVPMELNLSSPFPNPFNATVRFEFDLPSSGDAKFGLFDLSGREQLAIASGWHDAGSHTLTVDASALPAGIYLAVLETGGKRLVQRAVLLK